ncbi:MAG TPA: MerR family transcriptional regulator [Actinomycetota bacterium]|nr:MerR family transcriptional regulator [Actinomycetota bacterium]
MQDGHMTIGQLSKRAGLPVKTIRYYSDEGLLPPSERSEAGYRLYSEGDRARLDLILTLRETGLDLTTIGAVLARDVSLAEALELRLRAIEAHIVSLQHVAAALRAALRTEPDEDDLRRLHAVTRLSNEERKAVIERFYRQVAEGIRVDEDWMRSMIDASAPRLPDEPSKQQLDAWIELSEIVSDPTFLEAMRKDAAQSWGGGLDLDASRKASGEATAAAREALDRGVAPDSDEAGAIAERMVVASAAAMGREPDAAFRAWMLDKYANHDPRASRYWVLVGIINDQPQMAGPVEEWEWLVAALTAHLSS